ncbi:MAG: hypothetical protein U0941_13465 [Planctomycetaceae bacterium]
MWNRMVRLAVIGTAAAGLGASEVLACPMCKFALETDDPKPRAYMYSILFMLLAIGSVVGGLILFLSWLNKHERTVMDAAGYQHLFENGVEQHAMETAAK